MYRLQYDAASDTSEWNTTENAISLSRIFYKQVLEILEKFLQNEQSKYQGIVQNLISKVVTNTFMFIRLEYKHWLMVYEIITTCLEPTLTLMWL